MDYLDNLVRTRVRQPALPPPPPRIDLSPALVTESELVEGRSYTALWAAPRRKEFLGRYERGEGMQWFEILDNNGEFVFTSSPYITFERPQMGLDALREFPVGYFDRYGVFFEEGNSAPVRGGRGRKARRSTRRTGRKASRKHRSPSLS